MFDIFMNIEGSLIQNRTVRYDERPAAPDTSQGKDRIIIRRLLAVIVVMVSISSIAQADYELSSAISASPFYTATKLIKGVTHFTTSPFVTTGLTVQARGVAGKEQIQDEMTTLNEDMMNNLVTTIEQIRQPALQKLFLEISEDEKQMKEIDNIIKSGSPLYRIATAVAVTLMME